MTFKRILFLALAASCVAHPAAAFDSEAWLAVREAQTAEAAAMHEKYDEYAAKVVAPAEDIVVPLENHADGSIKTSISAKRACFFLDDGFVWGEGITIRQFAPGGAIESQVDADRCLANRGTRKCWVDGRAKAYYRGQAEIEGESVYLDPNSEYIAIFTNTVLKSEGRTLRGDRLDYDRKAGVAMLDGHVVLAGEEKGRPYQLDGGKAMAFFQNTNDLRRVVAYEGVRVKSENRFGTADRAVYLRGANRIAMYGGADAKARLEERGARNNSVEGRRITFWLDTEQVEVIDSEITAETKGIKQHGGFDSKQSR